MVLRSLAAPTSDLPPLPPRSLKAWLLRPLAWPAERALRARERLRSTAMVGFERLRLTLQERARGLVTDGVLPSAEALFDLDVDEVRRLEEGFQPDVAFWRERRAEIDAHRAREPTDVLHRDGTPVAPLPREMPPRLEGRGLTTGRVEGRAWVVDEPGSEPPPGFEPETTILVAPAVDLGWIIPFTRVAGVAVETGGDLSYGSIALREMGLPAVTNVRGLSRAVRTGDALVLNADEGVVERR